MLSVGNVASAGGASNYYTNKDNYYFLGESSTEWFGKGAEKLGLSGNVSKDDFDAVLKGELQDGSNLTYIRNGVNHHQAGKDLTFSAPKSVSILALVGGEKGLINAHQDAVKKTLSEIEAMVSTRSMVDGVPIFTKTENMVASLFMHDTSRNLDPQLHTHAIVANATFNQESGKWQTLSSDRATNQGFTELVWDNQVSFGALYRQFLREEVEKQGYQVEYSGKNGLWEIKGFPPSVIKEFSSRSQEIKEATSLNATAKEKTITTLNTRQVKKFEDMEATKKEWQQKFAESGITAENLKNIPKDDKPVPISLNVKEAVVEAISELEREKPKFSYSDIATYAYNLAKTETNITHQVQQEIGSLIKDGRLVLTDKHHSIYTSSYHLEQERDVAKKITTKNNELNHITKTAETQIGEQLKNKQSNFNLVSIRGSNAFEKSILDDVVKVAKANKMDYLVVVRNYDEKMNLIKGNGYKGDVITISDYLAQGKSKNNTMVSVFQSEKITLDRMNKMLDKAIENGDTFLVMDTGGRKFSGLTRDVSESMGIESLKLTENSKDRQIVFGEKVDKSDQLTQGVSAYTYSRFFGKDNTILQVVSSKNDKVMTEAINKVRTSLKNVGLLGTNEITLQSREFVFVKNFKDKSVYQIGNVLEQKKDSDNVQYRIEGINEKKGILSVSLLNNDKEKTILSMKDLSSKDWKMYKEKELPIAYGEKLKASGAFKGIKIGEQLTVTGFKKANFLFKERVVLENEKGISVTIPTNKVAYLQQNYVESYGASRNDSRDRIIAVVGQKNMDNRTINEISKGADDVLVITSMSSDKIEKNINIDKAKVTVTDSLKSFFGTDDVKNIQQASIQKEGEFLHRSVNVHIEKAMLETKDKVSFKGLDVVRSVAEQGIFSQDQVRAFLSEEIKQGNIIPLDKNNPSLNGEFVPLSGLQTEQRILELADKGKNASEAILSDISGINLDTLTKENGATIQLTEGQRKATAQFLTSTDTFSQIIGLAGVGKTSSLDLLVSIVREYSPETKIVALAPTHKATEEMVSRGLNEGQTYQSFLEKYKEGEIAKDEFAKTLFVVDEVSMIGNNDLLRIMELVAHHGGKAEFLGDPDQLKSISGGTPFALLYERGEHAITVMSEIVRQNEDLKPVVYKILEDQIPTAFDALNKLNPSEKVERIINAKGVPDKSVVSLPTSKQGKTTIYAENESLYRLAVDDYFSRTQTEREQTVILVPTNKGVDSINSAVHDGLVKTGSVTNSIVVPILQQKNFTAAEMQDPRTWLINVGNIVKQGNNYFKIESVDNRGNVKLLSDDGREKLANTFHLSSDNSAIFEQKSIEIGENDKIRIRTTDKDSAVNNNAIGSVKYIDDNGKITLDMGNGVLVKRDPLNEIGDRHFTLGYAGTIYSSQGGSFGSVIGAIPKSSFHFQDLSSVYVLVSRAVKHAQIYTNDLDGLLDKVHQTGRGARESTLDKIEEASNLEIRREVVSEIKQERDLWRNAKLLTGRTEYDARTAYFAKYDPDNAELLLKVIDDKGSHRGNYHLPFSGVSKEMDLANGYYKGDGGDGLHIQLSKEFDGKGVRTVEVQELYDYLENGKINLQGEGAIIHLDKEGNFEEIKQEIFVEQLLKQDEQVERETVESVLAEGVKNDPLNFSQDDERNALHYAYELESEQKERIEQGQQKEQVESEFGRLGNDEANILHHYEQTPDGKLNKPLEHIKQKELV